MDERTLAFLQENHAAAMITLRRDGTPHAVRVGIGVVDGKIWSSGTHSRVRTKHLRRDPRSTLFVFDAGGEPSWRWLAVECAVSFIEGPEVPELTLRIFPDAQANAKPGHVIWMGQEKTAAEYRQIIAAEGRLIYQFEPLRTYGMY
jgi:hypothetical protein